MPIDGKEKLKSRNRRRRRVRKKVFGVPDRPRLSVFRSNCHIYAQLIDDLSGKTVAQASSLDSDCRTGKANGSDRASAEKVGSLIARRAQDLNLKKVVFDRNGYLYHGRLKALADSARKEGLLF